MCALRIHPPCDESIKMDLPGMTSQVWDAVSEVFLRGTDYSKFQFIPTEVGSDAATPSLYDVCEHIKTTLPDSWAAHLPFTKRFHSWYAEKGDSVYTYESDLKSPIEAALKAGNVPNWGTSVTKIFGEFSNIAKAYMSKESERVNYFNSINKILTDESSKCKLEEDSPAMKVLMGIAPFDDVNGDKKIDAADGEMISTALDSIDKTQQDPFMATLIKAAFNAQLAADKIKKAADSKDRKERDDLKEEARKILEGLKGTDKIKGTMPSETDAPCGSNRRELLEALKRMVADAEAALGAKPKGGGSRPVPTCPAGQHMTKTGCVANGPGPTPPPGPGPTPKPPTGGGVYAPADDL